MRRRFRLVAGLGALAFSVLTVGCARVPKLGDPLHGMTPEQRADFEKGRLVFERTFTPETGLGPLFNATSCLECHGDPLSGGRGDVTELHGSQVQPNGFCDPLAEFGGPVFQQRVTPALRAALGIESEPIPTGAPTAIRSTPDVFGFGLLDAVPDSVLLALADPEDEDGDGISGRVNRFFDGRIGRFGRKALVPTLAEFNQGAFQIEQGVTVPTIPDEGTVGGQPIPPGVDPLPEPEISAEDVRLADVFVRFLAPPAPDPRSRRAKRGKRLFAKIGCDACHIPKLRTGPNDIKVFSNRVVSAYTDLLLHDMGPELADICFSQASPSEFRTEPLMGLRLSKTFLHDGSARSIEEAIRKHGGEAAASRDAFNALTESERKALLQFLEGL